MHKSYKFITLALIGAVLLTGAIPSHSLISSANMGDTSDYTPHRIARQPFVALNGDLQYDAFQFPTFNNYTNLRNLEADRILVNNGSYNDVRDNSDRTGNETQFLSARPQVFTSDNPAVLQQLGPDHVGPGTDPATARDIKYAQDPLLLSKASLQDTTGDTAYDNAKVRFYFYVHNNGEPPNVTGTAYGRQATNTRVSVQIPTDFQESPEVTGHITADNVTYYPDMNQLNGTITNQTALPGRTISDSVVVQLTDNGYYSGAQNRFMLRPDASSLQFIEHNSQLIVGGPANNEYQFNAPRTLATGISGANSFFNPTGAGLPLTSSQNGVQISPDGTIIGCFQNSGYLTFLADVIPEPTATAPQIKKFVSVNGRAAGTQLQTAINNQFFDANSTGQAVDFAQRTSNFRASYRVSLTNNSNAPITGLTIRDTFFARNGTTATAPQIINYSDTTALATGSNVNTYTLSGANEIDQSNPTSQVTYASTVGDHINFTLPLLPAQTTTVFYYDALIPGPVGSTTEYHKNDASIFSCDQASVCGLPSQHDLAFILDNQVLPTPIVDVEKYVTNQVPTAANLLQGMASDNAVDRANISLYQDADLSPQAVRFNADGTLPNTTFPGNYLVKLQKAVRTSDTSFLSTINVDDSYYKARTAYDASARTAPTLVTGSLTTYLKLQDNSTTPVRTVAIQLNANSAGDPFRVTSSTSGGNLRFNTGAQALIGAMVQIPNTAIASASTIAGPLAVSAPLDGILKEVLFSYQATLPTPSQTVAENSFNRARVVSYSYQNFGDSSFTSVPSIPNEAVTVANCAIENFCDDAHIMSQPPVPPTVKKYVSTAVRPSTGAAIPSSFVDGETATTGSAADFGAQNNPYITYYRVTVSNTGSAPLNNLALEDQFFLRNDTVINAQNVVDAAGSTLASGTVLDGTYSVSGSNETALTGSNRVTYVGAGSTTNAIRFTIPSVGAGQTIAFYYNVLVNPTSGTRPTGTGYHRNEVYVCFPIATTGCTPGSRDIAFSSDRPGTVNVTITKDVNGQPADDAGHAVRVPNNTALHYLITVGAPSANGSVPLTNVHISDNMLAGLPNINSVSNIRLITPTGTCVSATPCTIANLGSALAAQSFTLAAGQSATLTYDAVGINTTATDSTPNINTATVTSTETGPVTNPAVVIVTGTTPITPTITITKDVNSQAADTDSSAVIVNNGTTLNYLITVRNTSTVDVTNIVLSDTLVSGLPNVSNVSNIRLITPTGTCVIATPCTVTNLGADLAARTFNLAAGQSATLSYSATATNAGTTDSGYNRNTATATPSNAAPVSNPAVVQVRGTATLHTDFRIRKDASPQLVHDGDEVTYTIRVSPRGTNDEIAHLTLLITDDINDDGTLSGDKGVKFTYIRNSTKIRVSGDGDCSGEMNDSDGITCEDVGASDDIRITYRVRVSAPGLTGSDIVTVDNTASLRDDTPNVNIRDEADASVQVVGMVIPPPPAQPIGIEKTVTPGKVKRGEIANYTIVISNPNAEAETHRVVDTIGLNNGVVPGQSGGLVRFNPESLRVDGALYSSGTIGNAEGLTFTIPGNGRVVITYTASGEPDASSKTVSLAPNTATLDTGAYAVAFVELPTTGPVGVMVVFTLSILASAAFVYRKQLLALTK